MMQVLPAVPTFRLRVGHPFEGWMDYYVQRHDLYQRPKTHDAPNFRY